MLVELRHLPHGIGNLSLIFISPLVMLEQLRLELVEGALSLSPIHHRPFLPGYLTDLLLGAPTGRAKHCFPNLMPSDGPSRSLGRTHVSVT